MNLTLVIPVRNRQYNLDRVTKYFEDFPCRKIIADSSDNIYEKPLLDGYEYIYYGPVLYYRKMYDTINTIQTEHMLVCGDDDFIIKPSILEALEFIENNKEYVWVDGMLSDYNKGKYMVNVTKPKEMRLKNYDNRRTGQFVSNDTIERIKHDLNKDYIEPLYGLVKTKAMLDGYKLILDNPAIQPIKYYSKIISLVMSCHGNHHTLANLFLIKNCWDNLLRTQPRKLEPILQPGLGIKTIATPERCGILAEYVCSVDPSQNKEQVTNFLLEWFPAYTQQDVLGSGNEEYNPLYDNEKYNEEKGLINECCGFANTFV